MNYKLVKSSIDDIDKLIDYKKRNILDYADEITDDLLNEVNKYTKEEVTKHINEYFNVVVDDKIVGCLLVTNKDDGKLLDEIYLEDKYRGFGIGTDIIKNVLNKNNIVYLWAYKDNKKAISLYKRLGFVVAEDTDCRYFMKYRGDSND